MDDWFKQVTLTTFMLVWPPVSLCELVIPNLAKIDATNFSGFPALILATFYLLWLVDYGGVFFILKEWTK